MTDTSACDQVDLASYLGGDGGLEEAELVEAHLLTCSTCRAVVASWNLPDVEPRTGLAPGAKFDHYTLRAPLGAGGMGAVFRAYDESLGRDVAIKVLNPFWVARSGKTRSAAVHDLRTEARALARLRHPNIVTVYGVGAVDGRPYLAMELVRGPTLGEWQAQRPSRRETAEVWAAVAEALMAAHAAGIVHRDFKPENVIVDEGRPQLLDFGLAAPASQTTPSPPAGTRRYAAPEQLAGDRVDARADQYAFCTALHEVVFGHHPSDTAQRPNLSFPSKLRVAIMRGLEVDPARRHRTMMPLVDALRGTSKRPRVVGLVSAAALGASLLALAPWGAGPCSEDPTRLGAAPARPTQSAWIDRWNDAQLQACLDTRVRGVVDTRTYRARLLCLEDLAVQFEAHVRAGPWPVDQLSAPRSCLQSSDALAGDDPKMTARLDAIRTLYERLEFTELELEGRALALEAQRRGELRVAATALKLVAGGQLWRGEVDAADKTLRRAQDVARQARADVLEATLWTSRAEVEGLHREQPGVALGMLEVAESLLARAGATSSTHRINLLEVRGMIHAEYRQRDEAAAALDEAVRLVKHLEGPISPHLPPLLATVGGIWADPGDGQDLKRAESALREALALVGAEPDDGYDDVARLRVLNQLAAVAHQRSDYATAIEWMQQALALAPKVSEDPLDIALLETNLALTLAEVPERAAEAERIARRSIATMQSQRGPETHLLSTPRLALAHALVQQEQCPQALVVLDRLAATLPFDPSNHDRIRVGELTAACDAR